MGASGEGVSCCFNHHLENVRLAEMGDSVVQDVDGCDSVFGSKYSALTDQQQAISAAFGMVVVEIALGTTGAAAIAVSSLRVWKERDDLLTWCRLLRHMASKRRNPIRFMPQALLEAVGRDKEYARIRMFGLFGQFIVFPQHGNLISHVTSSGKYKRVNPLNKNLVPGAGLLTRCAGMQPFLEGFLESSFSASCPNL